MYSASLAHHTNKSWSHLARPYTLYVRWTCVRNTLDVLVLRQHSFLVRGACCTNATHAFVRTVNAGRSWARLKWNESGFRPPLCTYRISWARRTSWGWGDECPPDTGFEIQALAVWGRARYLWDTEAPHNTEFTTWMGKKHFCFFQTAETGNQTPNSSVKAAVLTTTLGPPSCAWLKYWTHENAYQCSHQKTRTTSYTFALCHMAACRGRRAVAAVRPALQ